MPELILISGKKRSGKDYATVLLTNSLEQRGYNVDVRSFADPMKEAIATTLGISVHALNEAKNAPGKYKLSLFESDGYYQHTTDMRQILQRFGTEAMKSLFGDSVWVGLMQKFVSESTADFVIVPDFRFLVEHLKPSTTIRIQCNLTNSSDTHSSETELDNYKFDYMLNNNDHKLRQEHIDYFVDNHLLKHKG